MFNEEIDALLRDYRRQIIQLEMENRSLKKSNIRMQDKVVNYFEEVHCKFVDKVLHYILFSDFIRK